MMLVTGEDGEGMRGGGERRLRGTLVDEMASGGGGGGVYKG